MTSPAAPAVRGKRSYFFFATFLVFFAVFFTADLVAFFTAFFALAFLAMIVSDWCEMTYSLRAPGNRNALHSEYTNKFKKTASRLRKC